MSVVWTKCFFRDFFLFSLQVFQNKVGFKIGIQDLFLIQIATALLYLIETVFKQIYFLPQILILQELCLVFKK